MQKDTQSVNTKVEALSRERDERPKVVSPHESEESFEEGNYSEEGRSSQSFMEERREESRERHCRRGKDPRREKIDMAKCKIPPFL
ncbi:hypothetical protein CR513_01363, partial [Mucuna pruriens]